MMRGRVSTLNKALRHLPHPIIVALDEAHTLAKLKSHDNWRCLDVFSAAMSAFKDLDRQGFTSFQLAAVFTSTISELNVFAPTAQQIQSQRLGKGLTLAGALTCVPFDVFLEKALPVSCKVDYISRYEFLASFGRPM
jgi:hypothetical protein